ncbi:hypothetical protein DFS34DRAFT_684461 [Phlyctochytrium arcticum]|nr:hypothetical protein DFS34DRAFT_684461 [Phlyctochytrium arcticum]
MWGLFVIPLALILLFPEAHHALQVPPGAEIANTTQTTLHISSWDLLPSCNVPYEPDVVYLLDQCTFTGTSFITGGIVSDNAIFSNYTWNATTGTVMRYQCEDSSCSVNCDSGTVVATGVGVGPCGKKWATKHHGWGLTAPSIVRPYTNSTSYFLGYFIVAVSNRSSTLSSYLVASNFEPLYANCTSISPGRYATSRLSMAHINSSAPATASTYTCTDPSCTSASCTLAFAKSGILYLMDDSPTVALSSILASATATMTPVVGYNSNATTPFDYISQNYQAMIPLGDSVEDSSDTVWSVFESTSLAMTMESLFAKLNTGSLPTATTATTTTVSVTVNATATGTPAAAMGDLAHLNLGYIIALSCLIASISHKGGL